MKFPARGEEIALERVDEVVVHAKQQMIIVTQAVSVADVSEMKCFSPTLYTEYKAIQALDTRKLFNDTAGHDPQITPYFSLK